MRGEIFGAFLAAVRRLSFETLSITQIRLLFFFFFNCYYYPYYLKCNAPHVSGIEEYVFI